ncbi:MAG: hypothetical protein ACOY4I_12800 [Bacillota bacterium]
MFEFVLVVVLANAIMLACLYFLRHVIAIRAPVLFIAVGISTFYCILYPFVVARVPYPKILFLYLILIMIGAALLYLVETRYFSHYGGEEGPAGMTASEALAVMGSKSPPLTAIKEFNDRAAAGDFTGIIQVAEDSVEHIQAGSKPEEIEEDGQEAAEEEIQLEAGESGDPETETAPCAVYEQACEALPQDEAECDTPPEAAEVEAVPSVESDSLSQAALEAAPAIEENSERAEECPALKDGGEIGPLVARAFDRLASGDSAGSVNDFFKALRLDPPPKLAAMLCVEIGSVYLAEGQKRQALAVLEMLDAVWGQALSAEDLSEIKAKINKLRGEV